MKIHLDADERAISLEFQELKVKGCNADGPAASALLSFQCPRWMQKSTTSMRARFSALSLKIPSASLAMAP